MTDRRRPDPIVTALVLALREVAERRAAERAERRGKMATLDGGKRGGRAA